LKTEPGEPAERMFAVDVIREHSARPVAGGNIGHP
jgi:hypothetical protein